MIDAVMSKDTQANCIARLNEAGVPCGRVQTLGEVFADPQVRHEDMVIEVDHPGHGIVKMTGFPVKLSETPCRINRPAPDLGADTAEVLAEVGYGPEEIEAFRGSGVI